MKQFGFSLLMVLAALLVWGSPSASQAEDEPAGVRVVDAVEMAKAAKAKVLNAELQSDVIGVQVELHPVCKLHTRELLWDGTVMESEPEQLALVLTEVTTPPCDKRMVGTERVSFRFPGHAKQDITINGVPVKTASPTATAAPRAAKKVSAADVAAAPSDAVMIAASRRSGLILELDVEYGGGCAEHTFELLWDGRLKKSHPPIASLKLSHNANGDTCEAIESETLRFELPGGLAHAKLQVNGARLSPK